MSQAEFLARAVLHSTVKPTVEAEVRACRVLIARNPGYASRLTGALLRLERQVPEPARRLCLAEEAVSYARRIDPDLDHHAVDLLIWALVAWQRHLDAVGRTVEAQAARAEVVHLWHPQVHRSFRCGLKEDCYAGRDLPPVEDWHA